ncbi:MAG: SPOR domain-containing protein [Porticoccus sp.]
MSENLKQRVVGALVLIALAVIIIPLTFDFSGSREVDTQSKIPPRPEIKPVTVPEPIRPENIVPAKSDEEMFQFGVDSSEQGSSLENETPALSSEGLPVAWVLQVGSFRDGDTAQILLKNLLGEGYKAFVRERKGGTSTFNCVFVGPDILKKKLVKEKTAIEKKYGVDAILVRFEP